MNAEAAHHSTSGRACTASGLTCPADSFWLTTAGFSSRGSSSYQSARTSRTAASPSTPIFRTSRTLRSVCLRQAAGIGRKRYPGYAARRTRAATPRATRRAAAGPHAGPMTRTRICALLLADALAPALAACSSGPAATSPPAASPPATSPPAAAWHQVTGRLAGAPYQIDLPSRWNHTLIVWSHGYEPSPPGPRVDDIEPVTRGWLLAHGYAIAGSGFSSTGWAVADAYRDQAALLDLFTRRYGQPRLTIAVGESLGGLISAGLIERFPGRFSGALPMCAPLGGGTGVWNQALDATFVVKTLLAPGSRLTLVHLDNPGNFAALAQQIITRALRTPAGRARLAL